MKREKSKLEVGEDGTKRWMNSKGQLHRLDGPAYEESDGSKSWWVQGQRHRLDGPAIEWSDGSKEWWVQDKLHRLDGPAVEYSNGTKSWWVQGKELTEQKFKEQMNIIKNLERL